MKKLFYYLFIIFCSAQDDIINFANIGEVSVSKEEESNLELSLHIYIKL